MGSANPSDPESGVLADCQAAFSAAESFERAIGEQEMSIEIDPVGKWSELRGGGDTEEFREELADALWNMTQGKVDVEPNASPEELEATLTEIERRFGWTSS